jgi:hypothetical protein
VSPRGLERTNPRKGLSAQRLNLQWPEKLFFRSTLAFLQKKKRRHCRRFS